MSENPPKFTHPVWVRQKELGQQLPLGHSNALFKSLYSSIKECHSLAREENHKAVHGGLLTLDFSPDGSLLVAGCEKSSFLMFDPLTRKLIRAVDNAHARSITNVKFLDSRVFATGSADRTISLWDARNVKSRIRILRGHTNTIEDIDFSPKNNLLITSGLDGVIYTWDMKSNVETVFCRKIFESYVLMRLRLNPDESKMIISTVRGYLMIVHDLDLNTLSTDDFKPERFGLTYMQQAATSGCNSSSFLSPKSRTNPVEIVADFPNAGCFNVISALENHPQGLSVFSRSTSEATGREWTCVHDIQEREPIESEDAPREGSGDEHFPCPPCPPCHPGPQQDDAKRRRLEKINEERWSPRADMGGSETTSNVSGSELPDAAFSLEWGTRKRRSDFLADTAWSSNPPPGPSSAPPHPLELPGRGSNPASSRVQSSIPRPNSSLAQFNRIVEPRFPRLTHYIEEPNSSDWYIENLSVYGDGRLISSPFGYGIRLLTFSPECLDQSINWSETKPCRLHELSTLISHSNIVLATKFSPRHCLLVSGCLDGNLVWYQPVV